MAVVLLCNPDPIHTDAIAHSITEIHVPDSKTLRHAFNDITQDDGGPNTGLWPVHGRSAPCWVESDNHELAEMIARHYGCQVGRSLEYQHPHDLTPVVAGPAGTPEGWSPRESATPAAPVDQIRAV